MSGFEVAYVATGVVQKCILFRNSIQVEPSLIDPNSNNLHDDITKFLAKNRKITNSEIFFCKYTSVSTTVLQAN